MIKLTTRLAASAATIAILSAPAFAQDMAEDEVIVTATKRPTTLQDTPVAVTVTRAETIERAEINDILDLQSVVPSLRVDQLQTSTNTNFIIRGFGNGANNPGIEPSVGVFVDGVYRSRTAASIGNLPNLERVEVLAGPQSTLFGKNASAGVISIVTQAPQFEQEGNASFGLGNYGLFQGDAYITGPVSDTLAYSIGGSFQNRDGYFERVGGDGQKLNDRDRYSLRGQLLFEPSDDTTLRLIGEYSRLDEICCGTSSYVASPVTGILSNLGGGAQVQGDVTDPYARIAYVDKTPENELSDYGFSGQLDHDFGNGLSLTSISAYRINDNFSDIDADFTTLDILDQNESNTRVDTFTQELRVTSNYDGAFNFQIGGFYFDESVDANNVLGYGSDIRAYADILSQGTLGIIEAFDPNLNAGDLFSDDVSIRERFTQEDTTYSVFGTVDYEIGDRLTLTGGLNYTDVSKEVTGSTVNNDIFANLDLATNPGFAAVTRGAIAGSFGADPTTDPLAGAFFQFFNLPLTAANFAAIGPQNQAAFVAGVQPSVAANSGLFGLQFQPQFLAFPNAIEDGRRSDDKVTWSIRGNFEATDDLSLYASVATGFKSSSFNLSRDSRPFIADAPNLAATGSLPNNYTPATGRNFGTRFAEPEEAIVYEIGAKARFGFGTMNLAAFSQTLENFQTNAFVGAAFVLTNAGETRVNGLEVQGRLFPVEGLSFDYAATLLDAEYTDFTNASGPISGTVIDLTGEEPDNIADFSGSLSGTYEWDLGQDTDAYIRAGVQYESPTVLATNLSLEGQALAATANPLNTTVAAFEGYNEREQLLVNMSAGIELNNGIGFQVWGRNIFGDDYATTLFPGVAQFGIVNGYPSPPATYGANITFDF